MKQKLQLLLALLFVISISTHAFAQKKFEKKSEENGIVFYGKTKYSKKNKAPFLCVKVHNTTEKDVDLKFAVGFFLTGVATESTEQISLQIPAGKKKKGRKNKLCWLAPETTAEEMASDRFDWVVKDFTIE